MKIDVRKFRKISSDEGSTVLEHPRGHKITIAHNGLSDKMRNDLDSLPTYQNRADDGEINSTETADQPTQTPININIGSSNLGPQEGQTVPINPQPSQQISQNDYNAAAEKSGQPPVITPQMIAQNQNVPDQQKTMAAPSQFGQIPGYGMQAEGIQKQAEAEGLLGKQQAASINQSNMAMQNELEQFKSNHQEMLNEFKNIYDDQLKGHINPNSYLENMGAGKKIASAIGLMLGGMGAGITGGPNLAMQFINNQIDRDINAQKENMGNKNNLMNFALAHTKNEMQATELATLMRKTILAADIQKQTALMQDPIAKARAQQMMGGIQNEIYQKTLPLTLAMSVNRGNPTEMSQEDATNRIRMLSAVGAISKENETRAYGDIDKIKEQETAKSRAIEQFDHLNGLFMRGLLSPHDRQSAVDSVAGTIQHSLEGRYNGEQAHALAEALLPNIKDFSSETVANKRRRLMLEFETQQPNSVLLGMGIKPKFTDLQYDNKGKKNINLGPLVEQK